jgi:uncharacterized protein (DUF362 family)
MMTEGDTGRRDALRKLLRVGGASAGVAGAALWLSGRSRREDAAPAVAAGPREYRVQGAPQLVVSQGEDPRRAVREAFERLGGAARFISRGDVVAIKPNIGWDRSPEQAANTNPHVLAETVRICLEAGAKRVVVTDAPVNDAASTFERSGVAAAARAAGAAVLLPERGRFRDVDLRGEILGVWPALEAFLEADKVINIPIAKHHNLTGATLGIKNWYGILGGPRTRLHQRVHEALADLALFMRPTLTILDAWRVLVRNGPSGGSVGDVELRKTIVAGTDPVALDAYAAKTFFGLEAAKMPYLGMASQRGLGTVEWERLLL